MMERKTSRDGMLAALLVVAVVLVAGGTVFASNAGFKFNMPLVPATGASPLGDNYVAIPYFNPYLTINEFCTQTGLGVSNITFFSTVNGAPNVIVCGSGAGDITPFIPGEGFRIRPQAGIENIIVVGSHDPTQTILLPQAGGDALSGNRWVALPYHTTAATRGDLCTQFGLVNGSGLLTIKPDGTGINLTLCSPTDTTPIVLGESIRVRQPDPPFSVTPAHF